MIEVAAIVGVLVLAGMAALQVRLVAGAPLGRFVWGGQHEVLPTGLRIGSAIAVALYVLFALLMLQAADLVSILPDGFADVAIWVLAGYLVLGVPMNAISRSRAERNVMTPLTLVLAVLCVALAVQ